jgi:hypothetical protein
VPLHVDCLNLIIEVDWMLGDRENSGQSITLLSTPPPGKTILPQPKVMVQGLETIAIANCQVNRALHGY